MENFKLREGDEFIELNNLIKMLGWIGTGGQAKQVIADGLVKVNGEVETRKRKKLRVGEEITFKDLTAKVV